MENSDYQLRDAYLRGDLSGCVEAIAAGASADTRLDDGAPLLAMAAKTGRLDIVLVLLEAGADVNARTKLDETALIAAVEWAHAPVVAALIAHGADVNAVDHKFDAPLHFAAGNGNSELCEVLVAAGANLEARRGDPDFASMTPVHVAIWAKQGETLKRLLELGADAKARDAVGNTPAIAAAMRGDSEMLHHLALAGADLQAGNDAGVWPLHAALENGHVEAAEFLLDKVGVGGVDLAGVTALHTATLKMPVRIVERLLDEGASLGAKAKNDHATPLHWAARADRVDVCKFLLHRGADPSQLVGWGTPNLTVFQAAVLAGAVRVIEYFVTECGENLAQRTSFGQTLIGLAGKNERTIDILHALKTHAQIADALGKDPGAGTAGAISHPNLPI